jgi:hypothetical protein
MTKPHRIERLYAWIVTDASGEDGIPAIHGPNGAALPMVGSDKTRIESFRPLAEDLARREGFPLRLVQFTGMVVLETYLPGGKPPPHR